MVRLYLNKFACRFYLFFKQLQENGDFGDLSEILQKVNVPYVSTKQCKDIYASSGYNITDGMIRVCK